MASGGRDSALVDVLKAIHAEEDCGNDPLRGAECGLYQDCTGDNRRAGIAGSGTVGGGAAAGTEARRRTPRRGLIYERSLATRRCA